MTIQTFMTNNGVKDKKTVIDWIKKGYIPRANTEIDYIPNSARLPFTEARARDAKAIYSSIVKATNKRKHVLPVLYKICDDEFNGYIDRLVEAGLIVRRVSDEVTYYDATIKATEITKNELFKIIENVSQGVSQGISQGIVTSVKESLMTKMGA